MTASSSPLALLADDLTVVLAGKTLVQQASLQLQPGQWLCVCGPNGAGKSTLLRALAGLTHCSGRVQCQGQDLSGWAASDLAQQLVWMGQAQPIPADLCVADVVRLGRWPLNRAGAGSPSQDEQAVTAALQVMGLTHLASRGLQELSGGECQRVLLARAMATRARVMLFDEPLNHLDIPYQNAWLAWLRGQTGAGSAVITVMHELNQALAADQLLVMRAGSVLYQGAPADPLTRQALQDAFDQSLEFHAIDTHGTTPRWVVLPRTIS
jgi:iron complex transport system ATP-binding protein